MHDTGRTTCRRYDRGKTSPAVGLAIVLVSFTGIVVCVIVSSPNQAQRCICALHCGIFTEKSIYKVLHGSVGTCEQKKRQSTRKKTRESKGARMALLGTSEPPDWTSCCSRKRRFSRHPLQQGTARFRFLS